MDNLKEIGGRGVAICLIYWVVTWFIAFIFWLLRVWGLDIDFNIWIAWLLWNIFLFILRALNVNT